MSVLGTAGDGTTASCTSYVSVVDHEAPAVAVTASPSELWPPNHKLREITLDKPSTDACGATTVSCVATSSDDCDAGDIVWKQGKVTRATLRSARGGTARVRIGDRVETVQLPPGGVRALEP